MRLSLILALAFVLGAELPAQTAQRPASRTRIVMLGTGNPVADPDRFGPATVVIVDSTAYLIDCGVGVVRRWAAAIRAGVGPFRPWDLRRLFITHLHSDHTLGYPDLIFSSWTLEQGPARPLVVFGPPGTQAMTDHFLAAFSEDIRIRTGPGAELTGKAKPAVAVTEIKPGVVYRDSLIAVTAFAVHHGTWESAFGFRLQTPDMDIVISGDVGTPSVIASQCRGCDVLIHAGGSFHRDAGGSYQRSFHTSMEDLLTIANESNPKLLILYHQPPGTNQAGLDFLRAGYAGRIVVARDLDVFP